ncbi:STM4015 family protein [Chamaesiphon minutus]|uniref:Leucine Rich Repeat (LRR)-containing protein n=1 Tax=Chamaesiphon minutus (strain ATCC 27169 / PCC 6605) TaxID=1173020 RepID=K9UD19_CHAP6|nr:STM4015 family protein [Chamaesiphon minutus]AFY92301.1 hypothetical protein Cha6605_1068 [Chamaesiphon minutus PCC 6605]
MGIYQHVEKFIGKPIVEYTTDTGIAYPIEIIYRMSVEYDSEHSILDLLAHFTEHPNASRVPGLIIGMWDCEESSQNVVDFLVNASQKLPSLSALFLGDITGDENEISWIEQSDLSPLLTAYPQLEHLQIRGNDGLVLGELKHDRLKTLIVETGGLSVERVREVCQAQLPQLEHLELWLGDDNYGGDTTVEDLAPILSGKLFPNLKYLGLRDSCIADSIATAVAKAPVLQQIKVLDLSLGNLGDVGAAALLASPLIKHLAKLDLNHHYIPEEFRSKFEELGIDVDLSDEQEVDEDDDEEYRYIAVSE